MLEEEAEKGYPSLPLNQGTTSSGLPKYRHLPSDRMATCRTHGASEPCTRCTAATRQDKTRQDKTSQVRTRQDKTDKTRQDITSATEDHKCRKSSISWQGASRADAHLTQLRLQPPDLGEDVTLVACLHACGLLPGH